MACTQTIISGSCWVLGRSVSCMLVSFLAFLRRPVMDLGFPRYPPFINPFPQKGSPNRLLPSSSSPYITSFGSLPSSIRRTCPSPLILLCRRSVETVGRFARARTVWFVTMPSHFISRIRRRLLISNVLSFFSWVVYVVHASLHYGQVVRIFSSSLSLKCALRESGCRIGHELTKMSRDHFWRSISRCRTRHFL